MLDSKIKQKIKLLLSVLSSNPWPAQYYDLTKLSGVEHCFRIRIGVYRFCYHVDINTKQVTVYRFERKSDSTYK